MSDRHSGKLADLLPGRARAWQRWQMDELFVQDPAAKSRQPTPSPAGKDPSDAGGSPPAASDEGYQKGFAQGRAEGYQAGLSAGRTDGHAQGLAQGKREAEQQLQTQARQQLAPLGTLVDGFADALRQMDESIAADLVELALLAGRHLARGSLDAHPERVLDIVRDLLQTEPMLAGKPQLWLAPEDLELVERHLGRELGTHGWSLQADPQIARGGCRVSSNSGEYDATWETRWQAISGQIRQRINRNDDNLPEFMS
ncbi:MAG: flagellar assembly protein FliH [Pseudomonadales bacterium]|nr:flagellar assembly protein FliH [Pseudomonadales bacterium]